MLGREKEGVLFSGMYMRVYSLRCNSLSIELAFEVISVLFNYTLVVTGLYIHDAIIAGLRAIKVNVFIKIIETADLVSV